MQSHGNVNIIKYYFPAVYSHLPLNLHSSISFISTLKYQDSGYDINHRTWESGAFYLKSVLLLHDLTTLTSMGYKINPP
jgi:hypothetical protein